MIKIKWFSLTAERPDGGPWYSENKNFEENLNLVATPALVRGYYPDVQEGIIKIVEDHYKGVQVLKHTTPKTKKVPENAVF